MCYRKESFAGKLGDRLELTVKLRNLRVNGRAIAKDINGSLAVRDQRLPVFAQAVPHGKEPFLDLRLGHMSRPAFVIAFVLVVALPDGLPVLGRTPPDLRAVPAKTIAADDLRREWASASSRSPKAVPTLQLGLDRVELFRLDNIRVAVLHVKLRHLALVDDQLLGEEVLGELLLELVMIIDKCHVTLDCSQKPLYQGIFEVLGSLH